jgi:DNA-binding MarR family transcriptional regulator
LTYADHRRQLVAMTPAGRDTYHLLNQRQVVWVNELADGLQRDELESAIRVLQALCQRLERPNDNGKD